MVDCSHANSQKKHENQILVAKDIAEQLAAGSHEVGPLPIPLFSRFPLLLYIFVCVCVSFSTPALYMYMYM
jgi:hypothetical protein